MKHLIALFAVVLFVVVSVAQDTVTTPDEAIAMVAPDGWTLEVEDIEATEAELREQGFDIDLDFPGVPIQLLSETDMTAVVSTTFYYGQDLGEYFVDTDISGIEDLLMDAETVLKESMARFEGGTSPDDILLQTIATPSHPTIYFYDFVSTVTTGELTNIDSEGTMSTLETGLDDQTMDDAFADSLDTLGDAFDSITTMTRYYAISFENTGVILIEVTLDTSYEGGDPEFTAMMNMMSADVDIDAVMLEFLDNVVAGTGTPIFELEEQAVEAETEALTELTAGLILPNNWGQFESPADGRIILSNDPNLDVQSFQFEADKILLFIDDEAMIRNFYDDFPVDFSQDIASLANDIATYSRQALSLEGDLTVQSQQLGPITVYQFNGQFEPFYTNVYFFATSTGEYAMATALSEEPIAAEFLRDLAVILNSLNG